MNAVSEHSVQASVQGRYILRVSPSEAPASLLAGFHGYGETAEDELARLVAIPGSSAWCLCAIEALHHFYSAKGRPGASWMTVRDRERRIAENVRYIDAVLAEVVHACRPGGTLVLHGFSQGSGMACRSAVLGKQKVSGVMLLGGDIPPELDRLERMRRVHLARGRRDPLYAEDRFVRDVGRLRDAEVACSPVTFAGGHEANEDYCTSAAEFLGLFRD